MARKSHIDQLEIHNITMQSDLAKFMDTFLAWASDDSTAEDIRAHLASL